MMSLFAVNNSIGCLLHPRLAGIDQKGYSKNGSSVRKTWSHACRSHL
jgi:hypothetical protein